MYALLLHIDKGTLIQYPYAWVILELKKNLIQYPYAWVILELKKNPSTYSHTKY
jgi:hypothetical protein